LGTINPRRFGVKGHHYKMFPVALPAWTPKDVVELVAHFRVMLYHEIIVMVNNKVVGGHKSIDSNQSISSTSGSVISGTSITSGGHFDDIDSIALSTASSPKTPTILQHAKNRFTWFLHAFQSNNNN